MIGERPGSANPWTPGGFGRFIDHYPRTRWDCDPEVEVETALFEEHWRTSEPSRSDCAVVLTPGLFGEWLPRCFTGAERAFTSRGARVIKTTVRTHLGVQAQAIRLIRAVSDWLQPAESFVWLAHSKGALDALWALDSSAELRDRCIGAVVVQPPVRGSLVVRRVDQNPKSLAERALGAVLRQRPFRAGVNEISARRDPLVESWLREFEPPVPTLCAVTWSIRPTSWVDSFHRTLAEEAPGHAHDGQFLLVDQRLPNTRIVGLPEIDHAQPVLGGNGFDPGRFWCALFSMVVDRSGAIQTR